MTDKLISAAEERLALARARVKHSAFAEMGAANQELLSAEREVARARGRQYAVALTLDLAWDAGAPMPFLISNGRQAAVIFYLTSSDQSEAVGVIVFDRAYDVQFGGVNDEAIGGHPLFGAGLDLYAAHEVLNSEWITEAERRNSAHPCHNGGWHERMKHYVLCFHDETLECIASGHRTERHLSGFGDTVRLMSTRLLDCE
jgi:hypothetical protein